MKPITFWKIIAIIGWLLFLIVLYFWLWLPDIEANEEPDWKTLIPIIIHIESSNNPNAISKTDCIGLMQISPIVLKEWNEQKSPPSIIDTKNNIYHIEPHFLKEALFNPDINIAIGTWYLKRIWFHYLKGKGTIKDMLICYNFGYGNWLKYKQGKVKLPKETRNYIKRYYHLAKESR